MAGHSKFANIKHRKGAQDEKRAKIFTKLQREIFVAAKLGGGDMDFNPRLRNAVIEARVSNMPKDRIDYAIKKATSDGSAENYEEVRYEGYAPGGIAIIVEALTDNRNRTAGEVRSAFTKHGGVLGETGSVSFMFDRIGHIVYSKNIANEESLFEAAVLSGADDMESDEENYYIICQVESLSAVQNALNADFGDPLTSSLIWVAQNPTGLDQASMAKVTKLIDALEDSDDVQKVIGGFFANEI